MTYLKIGRSRVVHDTLKKKKILILVRGCGVGNADRIANSATIVLNDGQPTFEDDNVSATVWFYSENLRKACSIPLMQQASAAVVSLTADPLIQNCAFRIGRSSKF